MKTAFITNVSYMTGVLVLQFDFEPTSYKLILDEVKIDFFMNVGQKVQFSNKYTYITKISEYVQD